MKLHERIPLLINMQRLDWIDFTKRQQRQKTVDVIVSLTSIPSRLSVVHLTIKSLLLQSTPPKKIVLWLHNTAKGTIPDNLLALQGERFQIQFTELDSPHCKLVPSLLAYPEDAIVTCDDDQYYSRNWLKALMKQAKKSPGSVIGQKFRHIRYNEQGKPLPYRQWRYSRKLKLGADEFLALGVGGVLYPEGSLYIDATNSDIYLALCPKADDLWFKAMAYLNGSPLVATPFMSPYYELMDSQEVTLKSGNIDGDQNVQQWSALCEHYPELTNIAKNATKTLG